MEFTEMKTKNQMKYIKKKIEDSIKVKIDRIECVYCPLTINSKFDFIIKGLIKGKYFVFPAYRDKSEMRWGIKDLTSKMKEVLSNE